MKAGGGGGGVGGEGEGRGGDVGDGVSGRKRPVCDQAPGRMVSREFGINIDLLDDMDKKLLKSLLNEGWRGEKKEELTRTGDNESYDVDDKKRVKSPLNETKTRGGKSRGVEETPRRQDSRFDRSMRVLEWLDADCGTRLARHYEQAGGWRSLPQRQPRQHQQPQQQQQQQQQQKQQHLQVQPPPQVLIGRRQPLRLTRSNIIISSDLLLQGYVKDSEEDSTSSEEKRILEESDDFSNDDDADDDDLVLSLRKWQEEQLLQEEHYEDLSMQEYVTSSEEDNNDEDESDSEDELVLALKTWQEEQQRQQQLQQQQQQQLQNRHLSLAQHPPALTPVLEDKVSSPSNEAFGYFYQDQSYLLYRYNKQKNHQQHSGITPYWWGDISSVREGPSSPPVLVRHTESQKAQNVLNPHRRISRNTNVKPRGASSFVGSSSPREVEARERLPSQSSLPSLPSLTPTSATTTSALTPPLLISSSLLSPSSLRIDSTGVTFGPRASNNLASPTPSDSDGRAAVAEKENLITTTSTAAGGGKGGDESGVKSGGGPLSPHPHLISKTSGGASGFGVFTSWRGTASSEKQNSAFSGNVDVINSGKTTDKESHSSDAEKKHKIVCLTSSASTDSGIEKSPGYLSPAPRSAGIEKIGDFFRKFHHKLSPAGPSSSSSSPKTPPSTPGKHQLQQPPHKIGGNSTRRLSLSTSSIPSSSLLKPSSPSPVAKFAAQHARCSATKSDPLATAGTAPKRQAGHWWTGQPGRGTAGQASSSGPHVNSNSNHSVTNITADNSCSSASSGGVGDGGTGGAGGAGTGSALTSARLTADGGGATDNIVTHGDRKGAQNIETAHTVCASEGKKGVSGQTSGASIGKVVLGGGKEPQPFVVPQSYQPTLQYHHQTLTAKKSTGEINKKNFGHQDSSDLAPVDSSNQTTGRCVSREKLDVIRKSNEALDASTGDNENLSAVSGGSGGFISGYNSIYSRGVPQIQRKSPVSELEQKVHSDTVERDPQGKIRTFFGNSGGGGGGSVVAVSGGAGGFIDVGGSSSGGGGGGGNAGEGTNAFNKSMTETKKKAAQREEVVSSRCSERSSSTSSDERGTLTVPSADRSRRGSHGTCNHLFLEQASGRKSPLPSKGRKSPSPVRGPQLKAVVNSSSTSSSSSSADSSKHLHHHQVVGKALSATSPLSSSPPKHLPTSKTSPKHQGNFDKSIADSPTKKVLSPEGPPANYRGRRKFSDTGLTPVPRRLFSDGRRGSLTDERTLVSAKSKLGKLRNQGRKSSDASSVAALVKQIHNLWGDGEEEEDIIERRESGSGLSCSLDDQVLFDKRRKKFPLFTGKDKESSVSSATGGSGSGGAGDRKLINKISCTSSGTSDNSPVLGRSAGGVSIFTTGSGASGEGKGKNKTTEKEVSSHSLHPPLLSSSSAQPLSSLTTGEIGCQTPDQICHDSLIDGSANEICAADNVVVNSSGGGGSSGGGVLGSCGSEFVAPVAQVASRHLVAAAVSGAACYVGLDTSDTLITRGTGTPSSGGLSNTNATAPNNTSGNHTKSGKKTATVQFQPIVSWDDNTVRDKVSPALRSVLKQGTRRHSSFAGFSDSSDDLTVPQRGPPDNLSSVLNKQAKNGLPKSKTSDNYKSILKQPDRPPLTHIDSVSSNSSDKKRVKSPSPKSKKNEKGFDYSPEPKNSEKSLSLCLKASRSLSPKSKKLRGDVRDYQESTDQSTDREHLTDSGNCSFDLPTKTVGVQATPRTIGKTSNTGTQTTDLPTIGDSHTEHASSPTDSGGWLQRLAAKCMASVGGSNRSSGAGGSGGGGLPRAASVRAEWLLGNKRMGSSPSSPVAQGTDASEKFWVPHEVIARKRAQSLVPTLSKQESEDDLSSEAATPASIPHPRELAFTFPSDKAGTSGGSSDGQPSTPPSGYNPGRRRASMHDAIDLTKIDTRLYDKKLVRQASVTSIEEESQGTVHVSIEHNAETGILTVNLVRAHNLLPRDLNGTANPYCRLTLLPGQRTSAQSRIHRKTLNPEFEEEFIFELTSDEVVTSTLEVSFYEYDQFSKDECLGYVRIPLNQMDLSKQVDLWRSISPYEKPKDQRDLGDVMFSLSYLPSAERLTVVIVKARHLRLPDDGKVDLNPFIKVCVTSGNKKLKKKKTSTAHGTNSPTWNEALVFNVHREILKHIGLEVSAYHDNKLGIDECIGRIRLPSDCEEGIHYQELLKEKSMPARWYSLS